MADREDLHFPLDRTQDAVSSPGIASSGGDRASAVIPPQIGRYKVISLLGSGAIGSVYLGFDTELGRHVALKVLAGQASSQAEAQKRFSREAKAAAALNHPGICTIYSIENAGGIVFLVLEYIRGNSFRELLDNKDPDWPPKPGVAASYILQVAEALRAAHESGVIHRDIKCSNLMRTLEDRVKVLDFGLAKMHGSNLLTQDGSIVGTPAYASPEQAQGSPVDARTDLWSLGVVFYELLTGHLPFPETNIATLTNAILHREPVPVRQVRPDVPAALAWVVQKLLAKNRDQRYVSAAALMADLRPLAEPGWSDVSRVFSAAAASSSPSRAGMESLLGTSERRAVTFLHLELSSPLAGVDPEDFESDLDKSRELCARILSRHEGYVQPWIGNTASVCFGFPIAREGSARLALEAGLALAEAFSHSNTGFSFRGGIETALVIADTSLAKPLSGEGFELARALCGLASPNQVLAGAETRRRVEGQFDFSLDSVLPLPAGRQLQYARVLHTSAGRHRFQTVPESALTPLFGRDQEMQILIRHWQNAVEGHGNVTLLGGAPGLGKSRLAYELKRRVAHDSSASIVECFCSPQHSNMALYPVIECLERLLFESELKSMEHDERLHALKTFLSGSGFASHETLPLFASLLGLALPSGQSLEITPDRQRGLTLEALSALMVERATRRPLLFVVEDLQWADPTTLEFLRNLVDHLPAVPLLALYTHRPEYISALPQRSHVSAVSLNRLSRGEAIQMVAAASRSAALDSGTREQIVGNSDGVPLFLEEMTKTVVETGSAATKSQKWPVPITLRDSFAARLDQLGPARNVARIASILGREFPETLLEAVSELASDELKENLDRLVEAEILYVRGSGQRRIFIFKHALLQEAAYDSLLKTSRLKLHAKAAELLLQHFPDVASRQPEIVARHFTYAGQGARAIPYWHKAGLASLQRSAYHEAVSQFGQALDVHRSLDPSLRDPSQELLLLTSLGPALLATLGFGAAEVGENYRLAGELIQTNSGSPLLLPSLWGVWVHSLVRSDLDQALATALRMIDTGERLNDDAMRLEGHWTAGNTLYWRCDLLNARLHLEAAETMYDPARFDHHAYHFGQDTLVATLCYLSFVYCFLGLFDQALDAGRRCTARASAIRHPFSVGWALTFGATLNCFLENYAEANDLGDQAVRYCQEQAYPFWISAALSASGRSLGALGRLEEGIGRLQQGIAMTRAIGSRVIEPLYRGQLAEMLLLRGDYQAALEETEGAVLQASEQGVAVSRLDILRIRGLALQKLNRTSEAEAAMWDCLSQSQTASCRLVELRAAGDLAELFGHIDPLLKLLTHFPPNTEEPPLLRNARRLIRRN